MSQLAVCAAKVLGGVALACYPLTIHAVLTRSNSAWAVTLVLLPAFICAVFILLRSRYPYKWPFALFTLLFLGLAWHLTRVDLRAVAGIPHAVIYISLLWLFARSLLPNHEALVTIFARRVHGELPEELMVYTRRVTWSWCLFFTAQIVTSLLLFLYTSINTWSLFVNVLHFPLVIVMFVLEYGYRQWRVGHLTQASLLESVRAFKEANTHSSKSKETQQRSQN